MRTFAEKPKTTPQAGSATIAMRGRGQFEPSHEMNSNPHLQRTITARPVQGMPDSAGYIERDLSGTAATEYGHDFSRLPIQATAAMPVPSKVAGKMSGNPGDAASGRVPPPEQDEGYRTAPENDLAGDTFSFGTLRIFPLLSPAAGDTSSPLIPTAGGGEEDVFEPEPPGGNPAPGGPSPAGPAPATSSCAQPLSMDKVVTGSFLGGLTMDSYFPDLRGRGLWAHAGTGGPFDTGSQAGGNAQLYGVIPSPCRPSQFHLEQTANPVRYRVGAVRQRLEGTTFDDIARSGRDASRAPFRQDFLGGGSAPLGYIISMADPPSVHYSASRPDVERNTNFVTSLVGPGGRRSVSWSQSVHVESGAVTTNTLT